ncbi:MAG: hypothetical protein ABWK00_05875 [Desulfurococcaceae archaeon]
MASAIYLLRPRSPSEASVEAALKIARSAGILAERGAGCLIVSLGPGRSATLWLDGRAEGDSLAYGVAARLITAGGAAAALKRGWGRASVRYSRVGHSLDLSVSGGGVRADVEAPWTLRADAGSGEDLLKFASALEGEGFAVKELREPFRRWTVRRAAP